MRTKVKLASRTALAPIERKSDDGSAGLLQVTTDLMTAFEEFKRKNDEKVQRLERELEAVETALNRSPRGGEVKRDEGDPLEVKAFGAFLRGGEGRVPDAEKKGLVVGDATQGGYLVPTPMANEMLRNLVEFSPVREAARVGSMGSKEILLPRRTGRPTAAWVGETEDRPGTQPAYGQLRIVAHEMACYVDVSQTLLDDSSFSVEQEIAFDLAEEFGRLEGEAFVIGDSVNKPHGFMADETVGHVVTGDAAAITADSLIDLVYAVPAFYRRNAVFMANGQTIAAVRKLKDGQGQYLWRAGIAEGQPDTLLGRPIVEAVDMPDIGAGAFPIVFGDFNQAYRIMDRVGLTIIRDPFTLASKGQVRFHARRRVGGGVAKAEAIRKLKVAAS